MKEAPPLLSHPKYRPDIDGLRAIAVLSVVAFHALPGWVKGGFVGVDVFFVISGFLISTIIFENLENRTFSISKFYARRIKRIFPALLVVLTASYVFGWFALLADEYKQLGKHIAAGAGFVSNFVLLGEAGYFDNASETKPLLHLWSLGIEEQFYIVWPLLVWLAWRKGRLLALTVVIACISFFLNLSVTGQYPSGAYYSPETRFWELLCGSVLAWVAVFKNRLRANTDLELGNRLGMDIDGHVLSNAMSLSGLSLLIYGFYAIDETDNFPGAWALVPVLGAVLVICAEPSAWVNRVVLSNKVAVWFGLISFPLYLWHWPILSFARIVEGGVPSSGLRLGSVCLSIAAAWLTYKFIERPIRLDGSDKPKVAVLVVLMLAVGCVGYNTSAGSGLEHRAVISQNISMDSGLDGGAPRMLNDECGIADNEIRNQYKACGKDRRGNVRFALMGDSKANSLHRGLVRTSTDKGRWLCIVGNGAPTPMLSSDPDPKRPLTNYAVKAIANDKEIEVVILVPAIRVVFSLGDGVKNRKFATYDYHYLKLLNSSNRSDVAFDELKRVVDRFVSADKKVVLVVDNPALPNPQDCIDRRTSSSVINKFLGRTNEDCVVPLKEFNHQIKKYRALLENIRLAHPRSVYIFDPTNIYCNSATGLCEAIRDGRFMYSYTDHISDYAAGLVGKRLNAWLTTDRDFSSLGRSTRD